MAPIPVTHAAYCYFVHLGGHPVPRDKAEHFKHVYQQARGLVSDGDVCMVNQPRDVEEDELPKPLDQKDEVPADWEPSPEALQAIWGETDEEFLDQVQAEQDL